MQWRWLLRGSQSLTPDEHNKYVGLAQLGYAGIHLFMIIVFIGVENYMFQNIYSRSQEMGGPGPPRFMTLIFVFVGAFSLAMTIPPVVAGYALLRRRPWAKVAGIVGGVVAASSFPIGTAVAVYTLWFLFSDAGKEVYGSKKKEGTPLPPRERPDHDGWISYTPPSDQQSS